LPAQRRRSLVQRLSERYDNDTVLSFDALASAILDDEDAQVRTFALRLLCECRDVTLIDRIIAIAEFDPDEVVQAEAAKALAQFVELGELEELSVRLLRQVEDSLLRLARSAAPDVQRAAIESLGFSSRPEVATLIESAYRHKSPQWVATALFAMGRSADPRWQDEILEMLDASNADVRRNAAQAAGQVRLDLARKPLLDLLENEEDDDVFIAAVWSLSQIGGEDVRAYLQTILDNAEEDSQIEFLEDALQNLDFTEEMDGFDLLNLDADDAPGKQ
jgi:HEAT repeat protein